MFFLQIPKNRSYGSRYNTSKPIVIIEPLNSECFTGTCLSEGYYRLTSSQYKLLNLVTCYLLKNRFLIFMLIDSIELEIPIFLLMIDNSILFFLRYINFDFSRLLINNNILMGKLNSRSHSYVNLNMIIHFLLIIIFI